MTAVAQQPLLTRVDGGDDGAPPVEGGTFNIGFISNITTDNWFAALDTLSSTYNQAYLGNSHVALYDLTNPGFVYFPEIASTAEPVKAVQEGDLWVVEQPIRTDMTWSDGVAVTANDLVFYFDTVREFNLGSNHAAYFLPTVLSVTAPSDDMVRIEFDAEPGLAVWQNGVGFADFVPSHFWQEHVEAARAASDALAATITDDAVVEAMRSRTPPPRQSPPKITVALHHRRLRVSRLYHGAVGKFASLLTVGDGSLRGHNIE